MINPEKEIAIGMEAKRDYEIVKDRLELIKQELDSVWKNSKSEETVIRERAFSDYSAIKRLEKSFQTDIDTGKMASMKLKRDNG